jgi:hypothetical protein
MNTENTEATESGRRMASGIIQMIKSRPVVEPSGLPFSVSCVSSVVDSFDSCGIGPLSQGSLVAVKS